MESYVPLSRGDQLDLSGDFGFALRSIESSPESYFITGKAGTGKSTLLRYFADNTTKRKAILAPTGIAAVNIDGETIHSFFGFPPEPITNSHIHFSRRRELLKLLDTIVIDEVSMVRADLMDGIDQMLRLNRERPTQAFGGVQMLFFGDIFQLQPVVESQEEGRYFSSHYPSPYFFDAKVFSAAPFRIIDLGKVFRQKDAQFIALLDAVRMNRLTESQRALLATRYQPAFRADAASQCVTLTGTNRMAAAVNEARLAEINSPEFTYYAKLEGEFPRRSYPADMILTLKAGAQVMFVKNAIDKRWVNGTLGKVVSLDNEHVSVQVEQQGGRFVFDVTPARWEIRKHTLDPIASTITTTIVGTFTQVPLKLAWAITIHKSQGLTFNNVAVDLGAGAFAHGQTYVALSRATSLEGLILKSRIRDADMIVDHPVKRFYMERIVKAA